MYPARCNDAQRGLRRRIPASFIKSFSRHRLLLIGLASAGVVLITACVGNDPKAASNDNFQRVIDAYLASHPACTSETVLLPGTTYDPPPKYFVHMRMNGSMLVTNSPGKYPDPVDLEPTGASNVGEDLEPLRKQLTALADAGLVDVKTSRLHHAAGAFKLKPAWTEVDHTYTVKPSAATTVHRDAGDQWSKICFGTKKVEKIVNYTEPASNPLAGGIVSSVRYTYSVDGVPDWAKRPGVQSVFPSIRKTLADAGNAQQEAALLQTSTGWEVAAQ